MGFSSKVGTRNKNLDWNKQNGAVASVCACPCNSLGVYSVIQYFAVVLDGLSVLHVVPVCS